MRLDAKVIEETGVNTDTVDKHIARYTREMADILKAEVLDMSALLNVMNHLNTLESLYDEEGIPLIEEEEGEGEEEAAA